MNDFYVLVGQRVREMRRSSDMTQEDLAESTGCAVQYISKIERGLGSPSGMIIASIAKALSCKTDYLLGIDPFPCFTPDRLVDNYYHDLSPINKTKLLLSAQVMLAEDDELERMAKLIIAN